MYVVELLDLDNNTSNGVTIMIANKNTIREIAPNTLAAFVEAHLTEDDQDPARIEQALISELAYLFDAGIAADERELSRIEAALFELTGAEV